MSTPPREGGPRVPPFVRSLRWILYGLLLACAALTLVGLPELQAAVAQGRWPRATLALPPTFLAVFIVGYGAYRFALVRAGRYPAGKALVQLGLMLLVLGVVASVALDRGRPPAASPVDLARALASGDADARAMAAELIRYRPREAALPRVPKLLDLLGDPSVEVRRQARATLVALAGTDAGGDGPDMGDRWRAFWRSRGAVP